MKHGVYEPFRFGERVEDEQYDAITFIFYFGEYAFANGLTDTLKPSHGRELAEKLYRNGVHTLYYRSKGKIESWRVDYDVSARKIRAHYSGRRKRTECICV